MLTICHPVVSRGRGPTTTRMNAPVFLSEADTRGMVRLVRAIEALAKLPAYREAVLARAPPIARHDFGPRGAFMGYDFHVTPDGPRLIEVDTIFVRGSIVD